jgi:hypothetical protein
MGCRLVFATCNDAAWYNNSCAACSTSWDFCELAGLQQKHLSPHLPVDLVHSLIDPCKPSVCSSGTDACVLNILHHAKVPSLCIMPGSHATCHITIKGVHNHGIEQG